LRAPLLPGLLYHACTTERAQQLLSTGVLRPGRKPLVLSADERSARTVAERLPGRPRILYLEARSAARAGIRITPSSQGLYVAEEIPIEFVLNADPNFSYQRSSGGAVVRGYGESAEVALILPSRRPREMWELPKGKLAPEETYEQAALREIREELGINVGLSLGELRGVIRYGFRTPQGEPRLKTVRFYFVRPTERVPAFVPPPKEVKFAKWFPMQDAIRAIAHDEIRPILRRAWLLSQQPAETIPIAPSQQVYREYFSSAERKVVTP
jgi:8-oxo-dGTP pyrophosphatase MutT (NUDIX family)